MYKNLVVSYASTYNMGAPYFNIDVVEVIVDKLFVCKLLSHASTKDIKTWTTSVEATIQTSKAYTFEITKANIIFNQLLATKTIKLWQGHFMHKAEDLKGKVYCKLYKSNKHATNNCVVFCDAIQDWIDNGKLKFLKKAHMLVNTDHFPISHC